MTEVADQLKCGLTLRDGECSRELLRLVAWHPPKALVFMRLDHDQDATRWAAWRRALLLSPVLAIATAI
jgi:hypothetical protein